MSDDLYDEGLAGLVPVDHIIAAITLGALTVTASFAWFLYTAFVKPTKPTRRTP